MQDVAHVSRLAVVGALTASIAHEIHQSLGAILANAEAGDLLCERVRKGDAAAVAQQVARFGVGEDRAERLMDLVCDRRRERTDHRQPRYVRDILRLRKGTGDGAALVRASWTHVAEATAAHNVTLVHASHANRRESNADGSRADIAPLRRRRRALSCRACPAPRCDANSIRASPPR